MAQAQNRKQPAKGECGAQAKDEPRDRRASHRVRDDQDSGQGSMSALSRLRMLERKRAPLRALRDDIV